MIDKRKFPRSRRIRKKKDIERILKFGRRIKGRNITLIYLPGTKKKDTFAILVGRKHGNAVTRNRIKRMIREVIRQHFKEEDSPFFFDILFCPTPKSKFSFYSIKRDIDECKKQLRY